MTLGELIASGEHRLQAAGVAFGHGTTNAFDEAVWLTLWCLGLPLDTPVRGPDSEQNRPIALEDADRVATLFEARIHSRKPAAYLTHEAWLQGVSFYVDERTIVPRSLIAEVIADGSIDYWLTESTHRVLDLCTGNGSLAVLAALAWPALQVDATDLSADALAVAQKNVQRHGVADRVLLRQGDGLAVNVGSAVLLVLIALPIWLGQEMSASPLALLIRLALLAVIALVLIVTVWTIARLRRIRRRHRRVRGRVQGSGAYRARSPPGAGGSSSPTGGRSSWTRWASCPCPCRSNCSGRSRRRRRDGSRTRCSTSPNWFAGSRPGSRPPPASTFTTIGTPGS